MASAGRKKAPPGQIVLVIVFALICLSVLVPVVNLFTKKPPKDLVDGSFACYDRTVVVPQATALEGETVR